MTHLTVWTCNRCDDTACEVVTEDRDASPDRCPLNFVASWVEGAQ